LEKAKIPDHMSTQAPQAPTRARTYRQIADAQWETLYDSETVRRDPVAGIKAHPDIMVNSNFGTLELGKNTDGVWQI
jgi:hypothetical protein